MPEAQVNEICIYHLPELLIVGHILASQGEITWIEPVMAALTATPTGKS